MAMRREERHTIQMKHLTLRLAITAALSILMLAVTGTSLSAQQPDTQTVKVPVTVVRADGKAVTGLKVDDFAIQEDGIKQMVSAVELVDDQYVVSYAPAPNPNTGYRRIEVFVDLPDVIVRARAGYFPR